MVEHSRKNLLLCLAILLSGSYSSTVYTEEAGQQLISSFKEEGLANWEEKSFRGNTSYKIVQLDGEYVLQADSRASASGMYKNISINLQDYPYMNWRWRIENRIDSGDERSKSGDDYAARIYVLIDGGLLFWKNKALSYVWANQVGKDTVWNNAYAGKSVKMFSLRSAEDATSRWVTEKRNIFEDLKKVFGVEINHIDAIAIMTDTDDSGTMAKSYYADIKFSKN